MVRKWADVSARVRARPGAAERIAAHEERIRAEIVAHELRLQDLRRARGYTQQQLAAAMDKSQGAVSRLEKQTDLYLSTLRSYVEAMGGQLELRAVFDDATVPIAGVGALGGATETDAPAPAPVVRRRPNTGSGQAVGLGADPAGPAQGRRRARRAETPRATVE